jgi:ribosomal protein L31
MKCVCRNCLEIRATTEAEETRLRVTLDSHPLRAEFNGGPQNCVADEGLSDNHVCDFCKCACANCDLL